MKAIIDPDVLIDYLQGLPVAKEESARYRAPHHPFISFTELMGGPRTSAEKRAVEGLLASMKKVELSDSVARRTVELRQSLRLKLPDAVVLASAEIEGCILVTRNIRDFPANDPRVRFPYAI